MTQTSKFCIVTLFVTFFAFFVVSLAPSIALADEFGDRFYNVAPAALGGDVEDVQYDLMAEDGVATMLQNIAPAAGEELESGDDISVELEQQPIQTLIEGNDSQN